MRKVIDFLLGLGIILIVIIVMKLYEEGGFSNKVTLLVVSLIFLSVFVLALFFIAGIYLLLKKMSNVNKKKLQPLLTITYQRVTHRTERYFQQLT